ncbi:MAG: universal stress protein [Leptolyngbyaceae cyanobacterium SU_3_3]|nr:universal stress protein [Leptolyngbyaceae cyanobacterium SU_3_3]
MLERILVALDSPETNEPLVTTAIALAKPTHARLLLLHALPLEKDETSEDEGHVCLDSSDYTSENHLEWQRCQIDDLEKLRLIYIAVKAAGILQTSLSRSVILGREFAKLLDNGGLI